MNGPTRQKQNDTYIAQPDLILINGRDADKTTFGCDQDWYADHWQRQAGCGPCTAATLLYYLSRSRPNFARLYTAPSHDREDFTHFMSEIWHYVTPGRMGVNEASILADGVKRYAASHDIALTPWVMKIPGIQHASRPCPEEFFAFIRQGLEKDCPVAFLNLSNGQLTNLDNWHWVAITGLHEPTAAAAAAAATAAAETTAAVPAAVENAVGNETALNTYATISDSGEQKIIDLSLWYCTTLLGGAVVYFSV